MRFGMLGLVLVTGTASFAAEDACKIQLDKGDRAVQKRDLVVRHGETVESAIAVDGSVILKAGAVAKDVIALNGSIYLEDGAHVVGNAISIGGTVKPSKGSRIDGNTLVLDQGLNVKGEDGKVSSLQLTIAGVNIGALLTDTLLEKVRSCRVVASSGKSAGDAGR